jgi:hypothetical protein
MIINLKQKGLHILSSVEDMFKKFTLISSSPLNKSTIISVLMS